MLQLSSLIQIKKNFRNSKFRVKWTLLAHMDTIKKGTNLNNYNLQQRIYFDIFQSFLFLTVDGFSFVTVF